MSRLHKAPPSSGPGLAAVAPLAAVPTPAPAPAPAPAPEQAPRHPAAETVVRRKQGGYYAHDADMDRARAAWKNTELLPGGHASWSDYQLAAVMEKVERDEAAHNGGKPWPALPPGKVKHSRRSDA